MKLSVVMAVFNGQERLEWTIDSILGQSEADFELIVVDDGSTDATPQILSRYAESDSRVRVFPQRNQGLTRSLIFGCEQVRTPIIARHDSGDRSAPDRFRRQLEVLESDPSIAVVSCATGHLAPGGETLYVTTGGGKRAQESLLTDDLGSIRGLSSHGSAMFRRASYLAAGGYRLQFRFAQDLDLWIRLAAVGRIAFVDDVLYEAVYELGSVSSSQKPLQLQLAKIAIAIRDRPEDAEALLDEAARVSASPRVPGSRSDDAGALRFIASCLRRRKDPAWRDYARQAVRAAPWSPRGWILLLRGR